MKTLYKIGFCCQNTRYSVKCEGNREFCSVYVDYMDNLIDIVD